MQTIQISSLPRHVGELVRVRAFLKRLRDQKTIQFLVLRDVTGLAQALIAKNEANAAINTIIASTTIESTLEVEGLVVANEKCSLSNVELEIKGIKVLGKAETPLPVDFSGHTETNLDTRLNWRYLDLRREENLLIFKVQTLAETAMREFWSKEGFIEIHSPKLMGQPSETGAELFEIKKYFDLPHACLAQSPQFYKQMAMAAGFEKIFEIGPVFRANPSFTSRHDTEFTSVDVEVSWIESHHDVMALEERWLQYILERIKTVLGAQIKEAFGTEVIVPALPFPKVTMEEAIKIVTEAGHPPALEPGYADLDSIGEKIVCEYFQKLTGHEFVFVTDYPASVRPFYHMRHENNPKLTKSFDLLWKGLEVTTGAQREHRYETLVSQAKDKKMNQESLQFYLDFFKYGCPPHGGYGFGLTRMLMQILNLKNVREVTFLYRGPTRLTP